MLTNQVFLILAIDISIIKKARHAFCMLLFLSEPIKLTIFNEILILTIIKILVIIYEIIDTYNLKPQHRHCQMTKAINEWLQTVQLIKMHVDLHFDGKCKWQARFLKSNKNMLIKI